ncbi:unnamed protein product [Mytilus coruscus]|uniref:Uncharacterized protein n=1 Tax=Mytilus coruscus TaxID=42192 RepID=A0A6J8CTB6_MYTCO|nr:unnamed protein product [Mytilus coruscus]
MKEISLRTVLTAVNQQSKDIEAIVDAKVTEKIGGLRKELQGANQLMKSKDLVQTLWAIDSGKVEYARDLLSSTKDKMKYRNKLIEIADTSEGGWDTARFWNVYSSGVDAFLVDWRGIDGLFVPPVSLIPRAFAGELQNLPVSLVSKVNLLSELLSDSRAVSTTKGYYQSFLRWKNCATLNGIENGDNLPTKAFYVTLY